MKDIQKPVIVEQSFNSSREEVWKAITNANAMQKWFFPNISSFEPKIGFETNFKVESESGIFHHFWIVTEVVNLEKISYDWSFKAYPGRGNSRFELFSEGNRTRLKLTFSVLESFPEEIPEFRRESGQEGWNYLIKTSLLNYLNA